MATWTDPAEVIALQIISINAPLTALGAVTEVVAFPLLLQEDLTYPAYPLGTYVADLGFAVEVDPIIVPPPVLTFGLDFNSAPLLFGYPQDPVWVVTLHCTPQPLQYWG